MAASEDLLATLHEVMTRELLNRIKSGEATAADMAVARGLLKDSNITCTPAKDNAMGELEAALEAKRQRREERRAALAVGSNTPIDFGSVGESLSFMEDKGGI